MPEVTTVFTVEITYINKNTKTDVSGITDDFRGITEELIKLNLNADHVQIIKCQNFSNDGTGKPEGIILE